MRKKENIGLKLMFYDKTCRGERPFLPGLTHSWIAGGILYGGLRVFDAWRGFSDWKAALEFLAYVEPEKTIREIQFWGHGKWGMVFINGIPFTIEDYQPQSPLYPILRRIAERVTPESLIWFRTCETFGGIAGHRFAQATANFFNCRVAGYTYIIGPWQAGLHLISPGETPDWPANEGLRKGSAEAPEEAIFSQIWHPRSISCLRMSLPDWV